MNLTIQTIVNAKVNTANAKVKQTRSIPFQAIRSSSSRIRLEDDRVILNKIKPLDKILFNVDNISFYMICCPIGIFIMGSDIEDDQNPKRIEQIKHSFLLGETEVTQELYQAVMGYNSSQFYKYNKNPVAELTWYDAVMFCNKLSQLLEKTPYYQISNIKFLEVVTNRVQKKTNNIESADVEINQNANGFRLPTEKEWEYAAKAGTDNRWAGCDWKYDLSNYGWFDKNSGGKPHPVKTKLPNEWGFYDMAGNVYEWCWDQYDSAVAYRVYRGGSWGESEASSLGSAYRNCDSPNERNQDLGFRVSASL